MTRGTGFNPRSVLLRFALAAAAFACLAASRCGESRRMIILGIDGMDPNLLAEFARDGSLPNLSRLRSGGDFRPLQTTMPPLSPVAWSSFITGMDPGGHRIFDFLHREPGTMIPEFSMSRAVSPGWKIDVGSWEIPLSSGRVELLRKGRAFWQVLEDHGVPTTIFRMPVNFPPVPSPGRSLSGMGTPDVLGTPGTFSFYTTNPPFGADSISGGRVFECRLLDGRIDAVLPGPPNPFRRERAEGATGPTYRQPSTEVAFRAEVDPERPLARITIQGREIVLKEGEWSGWVRIDFPAIPHLVDVSAAARFYLQMVRPDFRLYVTPLQINPQDPAMPISTPGRWSRDLYRGLGFFYTQELPEDTKALSAGIFSGREFWEQSQFVYEETRRAMNHLLDGFDRGLLFVYYSTLDQGSHMLWGYADPNHPAHEDDAVLSGGLRTLYRRIDDAVGDVLARIDDRTTLVVMSDHGFCPFYTSVNLNTWLLENGYIRLLDPTRGGGDSFFANVDWSRTRAYALGLNGLYVNLKGREPHGIVEPGEARDRLVELLEKELLALRDPTAEAPAVTRVTVPRRDFRGQYASEGPDIIVGFNRGYRSSWDSPLGGFSESVFEANIEPWSGDHGVDSRIVPGVLLTNRKITLAEPSLCDLTVAVLDEFGVAKLPEMTGRDCLAPR